MQGQRVDIPWLEQQRISAEEVLTGWDPVWTYRRPDGRTAKVEWCKISHPDRIRHLSHFAERVYLADIKARRAKFVAIQQQQQGWSVKKATIHFDRELCKRDLYYLAKFVLGYDRLRFHCHYYMAKTMQDLPPGYRGLRQFPRDTYKTTVCTVSYSVQQILRDPNVRLLIYCNNRDNAYARLGEIKNQFLKEGGPLHHLFPEHFSAKLKDQGEKGRWDTPAATKTQKEGTLSAAGVGGRSTSNHYTEIIADDFWDEKSVESAMMTAKTNKALAKLRYLLDEPEKRRIIFVGTRFSQSDPTTELQRWPGFHAIIVPAVLPVGRSLVPEKFSLEFLHNDWETNARSFSCNMMQNPKEGAMSFQREWFRYRYYRELIKLREERKLDFYLKMLVDFPGSGQGDRGGLHVVAFDSNREYTIAGCSFYKGTLSDFIGHIYEYVDQFPEVRSIIVQKATVEALASHLWEAVERDRRSANKSTPPWESVSLHGVKKERRILSSLQPRYQTGRIYHNPEAGGIKELEHQLVNFMTGVADDMPDALEPIGLESVSVFPKPPAPLPPPAKEFQMTRTAVTSLEVDYRRQRAIDIDKQFQAQFSEDRAEREDDYDA